MKKSEAINKSKDKSNKKVYSPNSPPPVSPYKGFMEKYADNWCRSTAHKADRHD